MPMDTMKLVDLLGWAKEKFEPKSDLGILASMPLDVISEGEVKQLEAAREGWLVGLEEAGMDDGCCFDGACAD